MAHDPWRDLEAEAARLVAAAEDALHLPRTPPKFEEPPEGMGDLAVPAFAYAKAAKLAASTLAAVKAQGASYGHLPPNGRRLLLEHTSVNPTGPLHVGRARNSLIGDALARVFRMAGYDVTTEFLVNDIGRQMVLLAWGARHVPEAELPPPERPRDDYRLVRNYQAANAR